MPLSREELKDLRDRCFTEDENGFMSVEMSVLVDLIDEVLAGRPSSFSVSPLPCGCHCEGGCGDPYAACLRPCPGHIPF